MRLESIDEIRAQGVTVYPHVIEDDGVVVTWDERNKRYVAHDAHCASIGATRDEAIANLKAYATRQQPLDVSQFNVPSWAKWVAADENGIVRAYAEEPIADILIWDADGLHQSLRRIDMAGIDWRRTLTAVNVEQQPMKDYRADDEITLPSPTVEVIVRRWQQLDGMTECDLAAAMVRADVRRADGFFTTLGMALEAVQSPQYNSDAEMTPVNQEHQMDTMLEIEMARGILPDLTGGERSEVVQRRMRGYTDQTVAQ